MPDEADMSSDLYEEHCSFSIAKVRRKASSIPIGISGDCDICDEHSPRLVTVEYRNHPAMACATCRDLYKLG